MSYLLDTPVFSEYTKKKPEPRVLGWMDNQAEESLYLSVLTLGELSKSILKLAFGKRQIDLTEWLENLNYRFENRIIPLDRVVMQEWGKLMVKTENIGRVLPVMNSLIAATAMTHNLTLVTRNAADFTGAGVLLLDLWE